jgi:thiol-disulfide isomerase/thioredoxin
MSKKTKAALITGGLFFVLLAGWLKLNSIYSTEKAPEAFATVAFLEKNDFMSLPGLEFRDLDQNKLKLAELVKGKIVIINFWATWCEPCAEEFPSMVKLLKTFGDDILILAESNDSQKEDILSFAKAFNLDEQKNLILLWDKDLSVSKIFKVNKLPESYIFGRDGKLLKKVVGTRNWANDDATMYFKMLTTGKMPTHDPVPQPEVPTQDEQPATH